MSHNEDNDNPNLPSLIPNTLTLTTPKDVQFTDAQSEVEKIDLGIANEVIKIIHSSWSQVRSISSVCRLSQATFHALEHRRKILGMSYGNQSKSTGDGIIRPYD